MIEFFFDEGLDSVPLRKDLIRSWIKDVAHTHGKRLGNLCYQFCDDPHILEANRQFLNHDYFTDIITFDNSDGERIAGDMLISLDTVASNAEGLGITFAEELHRVVIHGILHLCGFGDKSEEEESKMRELENQALSMLKNMLGDKPLLK